MEHHPLLARAEFWRDTQELDGQQFCARLQADAAGAAHYLDQSLASPEKGSINEGMALWHTARLVLEAESIDYRPANTDIPAQRGLWEAAQRAGRDTLYDIHAAMWVFMPWASKITGISEMAELLTYDTMTAENWRDIAEQVPRVVEDWHYWLMGGYSDVSLYPVAAARLSEKLTTILELGG